jgi:hypothetical protein
MRAWRMDRRTIAVVADVGEPQFNSFLETLGSPVARYSTKDGSEARRQWNVRHNTSAVVFLALLRQLRGKPDGEVVEIRRTRAARRAA